MRVLITGVSRGIGQALFAHYDAAGADVLGTVRSAHPADPRLCALDVTQAGQFAGLADATRDKPLDLLVCNAGVYPDKGLGLETGIDPSVWAQGFAVNVTGVWMTVQTVLSALRLSPAPKIAIISSIMGSSARAPGGSYVYRATKAAVTNLGRNLAADLASERIAVGIYHPGWVRTDMGGTNADIDLASSVAGLTARFDALGPDTTGTFTSWDGTAIDF
jgi:NAD(P)-dependent dehydrogenase (short-subunit alcohol dehydrogenase family)